MCGIFGMSLMGTPTDLPRLQRLVTMLALTSAERGTDATGIAILNDQFTTHYHKDVLSAYAMVRRKKWRETLAGISAGTRFILGHTRRATKGSNIANNSHPFFFYPALGNLVGVHNGTITNHASFNTAETYQVDSANVLHAIAHLPNEEWPALLSKLQGTFALVWIRNGQLHVARNPGSPLVTMWCRELGARIFASTDHMIETACSYAGVDTGRISTVPEGVLQSYTSRGDPMGIRRFTSITSPIPLIGTRAVSTYDTGDYDWAKRARMTTESRYALLHDSKTPWMRDTEAQCATCYMFKRKADMFLYRDTRMQCGSCRAESKLLAVKHAMEGGKCEAPWKPLSLAASNRSDY